MARQRVAYLIAAAIVLTVGLACGESGQQCKAGQERTKRVGHSIVHERCVKRPDDVTPQWHQV